MRIVFVTGCLEPGRDGVGDYTRDLAAGCIRAGRPAAIVALHDPYVAADEAGRQRARGTVVPSLRLPARAAWDQRVATARRWIDESGPDWISLQFVPYAFHPRGLARGLGLRLVTLCAGRAVHVMCHELWIGAERNARPKHRLVGLLQRRAVQRLLRELAPRVIHTSNLAYRRLLAGRGVGARLLPLCGSVPLVEAADASRLAAQLRVCGVPEAYLEPRGAAWWFGLFGSIHPEWSPEPAFSRIAAAAASAGRRVVVASIGRQGPGAAMWASLVARYSPGFAFAALGERPAAEIAEFLRRIDVGIATTPWQLIGKSATTAAMLDHGVPVLVTRDDVTFDGEPGESPDPLLWRLDEGVGDWLLAGPHRRAPRDGLEAVTRRFLADLEGAARIGPPARGVAPVAAHPRSAA